MTLVFLLISIAVAAFLGAVMKNRWRAGLLLTLSALAVYALQPALPIRGLDFSLPTITLALTALTWLLVTPPEARAWKNNWGAIVLLTGILLTLQLTRFLSFDLPLTASRPPQPGTTLALAAFFALMALLVARFTQPGPGILSAAIFAIIFLFVLLKTPALSLQISLLLRSINGQALTSAAPLDIRWLGFSYIAFRLLHTLRDRQNGRLPAVSLAEFGAYVLFFPTLSAGPIDRIERFVSDLRRPLTLTAADLGEAAQRLMLGLFKKFVLADALALMALNAANASQVRGAGWGWVLLYAYTFQIYFDFSGYSDIAIGLARLMGIKLPENFNAPYAKPNLTQFWNNWHMSLTQWFRAYFFNPLTRALRAGHKNLPAPAIIFLTQVATMLLISLWHGVTFNFALWGLWHGLGLFIHNRWAEAAKTHFTALPARWQTALNIFGALLTFHYVALGWVFFALPEPTDALHFFGLLFGQQG